MADPDSLAKGPDPPEPVPQAEGQPIDPPEEAGAIGTASATGGGGGALGGGAAAGGGAGGGPIGFEGGAQRARAAPLGGVGTAGVTEPVGPSEAIFTAGRPIGGIATLFNIGGAPVNAGTSFLATTSVEQAGAASAGAPVGGPSSIFNIGGAPIAVLGGVFSGGLPIAGPVTQIFRGGSGPQPNTLFVATLSPAGPIGNFFIGSSGAPIGVDVFRGGGLPIGPSPEVSQEISAIGFRTALVTQPAIAFGGLPGPPGVTPIGGGSAL